MSPSLDDVLIAFSVEIDAGAAALQRYLRDYPQYGAELVELSRELARGVEGQVSALAVEDDQLIQAAWDQHRKSAPLADPLAELLPNAQRELATKLGIPRQVLAAFREHRIIVDSVPARFLRKFASLINRTAEELAGLLALPAPSAVRSYSADSKPGAEGRVSFEKILIEAGVPEEARASLMEDGD